MAKYIERKEPLTVDIEFYSSEKGHIAVIPHSQQDDPRVGLLNSGAALADHERVVYEGDAIIFWGSDDTGDKYSVMRADSVDAFFEKASGSVGGSTSTQIANTDPPALSEGSPSISLDVDAGDEG